MRTGVEDQRPHAPEEFVLLQNYPNPFNPMTKIRFSLPAAQLVSLKVFDLTGRELATLLHERKAAGSHEIAFDASRVSASGVYFYQLSAGGFKQTRKMILMQ